MQILITGATGFLGRQLAKVCLDRGDQVRGLSLGRQAALLDRRVDLLRGDIRDPEAVVRAVEGCEVVYHAAALVNHDGLGDAAQWDINVEGTRNVARACVEAGVRRMVFVSSVSVYGRTRTLRSANEDTPVNPDSNYGASKAAAEKLLREMPNLRTVIARPCAVWGAETTGIGPMIRKIANREFRILGKGQGFHTIADVSDLVEGLWLCGTVPGVEGRTYILAGIEPMRLVDVVNAIAEECGIHEPVQCVHAGPLAIYTAVDQVLFRMTGKRLPKGDRLDLFSGDRSFDITRARKELGYHPKVRPREVIRRTIAWYRSSGRLPN